MRYCSTVMNIKYNNLSNDNVYVPTNNIF